MTTDAAPPPEPKKTATIPYGTEAPAPNDTPPPIARTAVAGGLMGLANLVPGVSGGTMVLVMGVYDRFVDAAAGISRGKVTTPRAVFVAILVSAAAVMVVGLAGVMSRLVADHRSLMYALFIGMTLAGTPPLWRMTRPLARPIRPAIVVCFLAGLTAMVVVAATQDQEAKEQASALRETEAFRPAPALARDALGGTLAMSAMVLPGISGAHMLLVLGRYEHVTGAISLLKSGLLDGSGADVATALSILVPVGVAAILSLVLLSNALKWLLSRHERLMGGALLGVLWGSTLAIWPFDAASGTNDYLLGGGAFLAGFAVVFALTRLVPSNDRAPHLERD